MCKTLMQTRLQVVDFIYEERFLVTLVCALALFFVPVDLRHCLLVKFNINSQED